MENNSKAATPVNIEGVAPDLSLPVTIVADAGIDGPELPIGFGIGTHLSLPVTTGDYPTRGQLLSGAVVLRDQEVVFPGACELEVVAGYNSEPTATQLLWVQLFDSALLVLPGEPALVTIPVYGGKTPFSFALPVKFATGLVIAISADEASYADAGTWLSFTAIYRFGP
jgi:hypothetical protein